MSTKQQRSDAVMKFVAGLFFIGGICLFVIFVFTIGKDKGLAQQKFQITVLFRNVGGLNEGAPTLLAGVNVGTIDSIDFLPNDVQGRRVKVSVNIFSKYRAQFSKNIRCAIKTEGVLGEKILEIYVVDGPTIDLSQPIIGEDPFDVQDIAESFAGAAKSFTKTSEALNKIDIVAMSDTMRQSSEALMKTANGFNSMMDEFQEMTVKARRLMDRVEEKIIEGTLFKVF